MDLRVPMQSVLAAFGVPVTVTPPGEDSVETVGAWVTPGLSAVPGGFELQRREQRRVLVLSKDAVTVGGVTYPGIASVPLRTRIEAPERDGDASRVWLVDGHEAADADHHRPLVVPDSEES